MATMYEMIMDLPLFKGVGKDQVSYFLEKTNIGFRNYSPGEVLAKAGDEVQMVRFVISGEITLVHPLEGGEITIEERSGFGKVLGADRLFGLSTDYPYDAISVTRTSVMEFSKVQYVNLLHSDRIYMLNFFNYLSLRAQRPMDCMARYHHGDIRSRLCQLLCLMTDPGARGIVINGTPEALSKYCGTTVREFEEWKRMALKEGLLDANSESLHVLSRRRFLDY